MVDCLWNIYINHFYIIIIESLIFKQCESNNMTIESLMKSKNKCVKVQVVEDAPIDRENNVLMIVHQSIKKGVTKNRTHEMLYALGMKDSNRMEKVAAKTIQISIGRWMRAWTYNCILWEILHGQRSFLFWVYLQHVVVDSHRMLMQGRVKFLAHLLEVLNTWGVELMIEKLKWVNLEVDVQMHRLFRVKTGLDHA